MQPLANPYELIELIGRGPNGTVWRATHRATREMLAVKVLDARFSRDHDVLDRLERERPVLTAFVHPADVRVRDVVDHSGQLALAMELVEGGDLRRHLVHLGVFAPALAARLGAAAAEALAAAHQVGVVHCDVKPSNVLIARPSGDVRITDYRVARLVRGYGEGSGRFSDPGYAAPEVILGGPPVPATDVYGLGLVLYEILTGSPLCYGTDPLDVLSRHLRRRPVVPSDVTPKLRLLVEACLAVDPGIRPTADEVAERLSRLVNALPGDPQIRVWPPAVTTPAPRLPTPPTWPPRMAHAGASQEEHDGGEPPEPVSTPVSSPAAPVARPVPAAGRSRPVIAILITVLLIAAGLAVATVMDNQSGNGRTAGGGVATDPTGGPTPSLASAASVPKPPASAAPATAEGAAAFVRYWFDAVGYATATGNTGPLESASTPDCTVCGSVVKAIRSAYDSGGRMRGGQYTVRDTSSDSFFNLDQPKVIVVYDRAPRSTVGSGGSQVEATPGTSFITAIVILERTGDHWRVRGVTSGVPFS